MALSILSAILQVFGEPRKAGKCKEVYFRSDLKGSVVIWEVSSDEEVTRDLIENPMWLYMDLDIRPLLEWDATLKEVTKYSQQAVRK
jgi:muconolactone delta-isomerase